MGYKAKIKVQGSTKPVHDLLKSMEDTDVLVGIPADAGDYPDGTSVAMVAAVHEYGSDKTPYPIPERSFLRSTVEENQAEYVKFLEKGAKKAVDKGVPLSKVLDLLGQKAAGDVQQKITDLKEPPNAESTIAQKKSDNPLMDTGHLIESVRYEVRKKKDAQS